MICAKTSLPWFIGGPRDGRHHGLANAPIRVEIETRSKHELSFTNQTVIAPLVLDVGTALGLELDELEWTRADRMGAHVLCRHVARVHGRHSRSQQHDERRLRFAQMESGLIVIIDRDILEIGVPDAARILAEIVLLAEEAMPGTAYVFCRERFAVVPLDALAQLEGQLGTA